ncbi:unnamed protein product [Kuraishia capsulata CBS 1993]|uniref:HTH CENPB-type domain-containing protein n=1 Tax=Kuraishia capsulata CBS 1993 TaxID=1382522 RepID=W6MWU2_9ASCO|nr:uncharacterized protein KUCA_T00003839001 [Kuraishia capsulata CBS 1993]CDK27860.1 unnamed protein product [Kuraishia capsulata CBS 1993]
MSSTQFRQSGLVDLQSSSAANQQQQQQQQQQQHESDQSVNLTDTSGLSFDNSKLPRATLEQKIRVLDYHNSSEKKCQQHTVNFFRQLGEFSITKSTMNRWVLGEKRLRQDYKNLTLNNNKLYKTRPKFRDPEINRCLEIYYEQLANESSTATERELLTKWSDFYKLYHDLPQLDPLPPKSNGWLHHFKKRNSLKKELMSTFLSQQAISNVGTINDEFKKLSHTLSRYQPHQIFAIDEFAFHTKPSAFKPNIAKQSHELSLTDPSERVIAGICCNTDGSVVFDPMIVTDAQSSRHSGIPTIFHSKTGLLSSEIFAQYVAYIDDHIAKTLGQRAVLLLDDLPAHIFPTDRLRCIDLCYYTSGLNKELYRPLDFGIGRIFKTDVKHSFLQNALKRTLVGLDDDSAADLFTLSKDEIIATISHTWSSLKFNDLVISASFRNSGIFGPQGNVNGGGQAGYALRDTTKESHILNIFNFFLEKGWLNDSILNPSRSGVILDDYLFPEEEDVRYEHLTDLDIVRLVKREVLDDERLDVAADDGEYDNGIDVSGRRSTPSTQDAAMALSIAASAVQNPNDTDETLGGLATTQLVDSLSGILPSHKSVDQDPALDPEDSKEIGRLILNRLKPFFSNPNVAKRYSKSAEKFVTFASTYLQETNDIFLKDYRNGKDLGHEKINGMESMNKRRRVQYDSLPHGQMMMSGDNDNIDNQLIDGR